jgi:uncharacterized membrane protein YkgB
MSSIAPGGSPQPSRVFRRWDREISAWMYDNGRLLLRLALAIIFIWFGALKIFQASPADDLIKRTVYWLRPEMFLPILGGWEVAIGVCLLFRPLLRVGGLLLALQLPGTFLPLVVLPEVCFERFPFVLTMEGQYIIKNLLIIGAAIVVGGTVNPPVNLRSKV